jgi:hypothetical protein
LAGERSVSSVDPEPKTALRQLVTEIAHAVRELGRVWYSVRGRFAKGWRPRGSLKSDGCKRRPVHAISVARYATNQGHSTIYAEWMFGHSVGA